MTFSKFDKYSSPLFKQLNILKLIELVKYFVALYMYKFHSGKLPSIFNNFFTAVNDIHNNYNTRLACRQIFYLPNARTYCGIFNIRFQGRKIWNPIDENLKTYPGS